MNEYGLDLFERLLVTALGVACIVGAFHPQTKMPSPFVRWSPRRPVTRPQRVVFFIFGCLFVLYGVKGWS